MGIYVHIPFCRNKCFYCGFYSVVSLQWKEAYLRALCREMEMRKEYLQGKVASTLYMGGGTPSYLNESELELIVNNIQKNFILSDDSERSVEVNPEDIVSNKLSALKYLGFNRLTIGVQSFNDSILKRINRTHSGKQAIQAVENAAKFGFDNIGIDLIIGLPGETVPDLVYNIEIIKSLPIDHLSVYILSIDSNSVFEKLSEKGKFKLQEDDYLAEQYLMISEYLKSIGFEHYEISNFAKNFKYSRHNTAYWQQKPYIGLGAAAHSYDGESRQWNISQIKTYIESLNNNRLNIEKEILTDKDKYNEYLMTNFRTQWGIDLNYLMENYSLWWKSVQDKVRAYCDKGFMATENGRLRMTERGWLISDGIFSELFV